MRKEYEMTAEQEQKILEACKFVPYLVFGGIPQRSPQERANDAWEALGKELGFAYMTVRATGKGHRFFTAEVMVGSPGYPDAATDPFNELLDKP